MEEIIKSKQFAYKIYKRNLMIMKLSALFLFVSIFILTAENVHPQQKEISLKLRNTTIINAISELEKVSDYVFLITDEAKTELNKRTSINVSNESINNILELLLQETKLKYSVVERQVSLYKNQESIISKNAVEKINEIVQQNKQIRGRVIDNEGVPIIGANIIEAGSTNGTVTDVDGNFTLEINENADILISYIGYLSQLITTSGKNNFEIILFEDTKALEELVVVGYGVQKKKLVTGATSQIGADQISKQNSVSVVDALRSSSTGMQIVKTSGEPGSDFRINIRGLGTTGDATPLFIVDGVPVSNINYLNPSEIASIDILKDAASSSIYGSRAANGVVLVTTKSGNFNSKPTISYDGYYGEIGRAHV